MSAPSPNSKGSAPFKDVLIGVLALAAITLTAVAWRQHAEIRRLALASAADRAAGEPHLRTATARNLTFVTPPVARAPEERLRTGDQWLEESFLPRARAAKSRATAANPLAALIANPQFFQMLALHRQATLDTRFAGLFRRLDLGADQLATFKRLLAEKENVALDVVAVSETQPDGPLSDEMFGTSVNAARARVEDEIRTSLGDDRYTVYQEYTQTLPQRTVVAQLEQRLSYSPTPLSPAQSESLVRILVAHAPPAASAETAPTSTVVVGTGRLAATPLVEAHPTATLVTNEVLAEAQTVLSTQQVAALNDLRVEQEASAQTFQLIRDSLPISNRAGGRLLDLMLQ